MDELVKLQMKPYSDFEEKRGKYQNGVKDLSALQSKYDLESDKSKKETLNKQILAKEQELKQLEKEITKAHNDLAKGIPNTKGIMERKQALGETRQEIKKLKQSLNPVETELRSTIENGAADMFSNVLLEGQSFKEGWKGVWKSIGQFAMQQLMNVWLFTKVLNLSRFGSASRGTPSTPSKPKGAATGGLLPGYADGGHIVGAGTGTSDSILAYLADKDRFVYLSNGEYVMTAEATKRIGKGNLDKLNYGKYADGGALSPIPYVPQLSPAVTRKAQSIDQGNPNAKMEKLMQEQMGILKNIGDSKDGNSGLIVLNTHASSDDVMRALQQNPRAIQAILGNQRRHGFR